MTNISPSISSYTQEYLDNIQSTATVYFADEFVQAFSSKKYKYFAFIEGNDEPYYIIPCENILGKGNTYFVRCNGKENVKELVHLLENTNEVYKTANFFGIIDKDYGLEDEFSFNGQSLKNNHLYITPHYSFENFYININTFLRILKSEFGITEFGNFSIDYKNAVKNFEDRLSEFIKLIIDVDKKYRAYQISKINSKNSKQDIPNYRSNDIKLNKAIKVNIESVCLKAGTNTDECFKSSQYDIDACISPEALSESQQYYQHNNTEDYCKTIRGKFMIWFLVNYLETLKADLHSDSSVCFSNRKKLKDNNALPRNIFYKCKLDISIDNACSVLAQYAEQPQCLIRFLNNAKI